MVVGVCGLADCAARRGEEEQETGKEEKGEGEEDEERRGGVGVPMGWIGGGGDIDCFVFFGGFHGWRFEEVGVESHEA